MNKNIRVLNEGEQGFGMLVEQDSGYVGVELNKGVINEDKTFNMQGNNTLLVDCILQKANTKNRNGRIYPKEILAREVEKYKELIRDNRALSSTDHPDSISVSLKREECSHLVKKIWWEGDTVLGQLEIITSPKFFENGIICCVGDFIANLLRLGVKLGISSRGLGSLKTKNGENYVQEDFELICFDLVSSPSTPNAYLYFNDNSLKENYEIKKIDSKDDKLKKFLLF